MKERRGASDDARAAAIANAQLPPPEVKRKSKTLVLPQPAEPPTKRLSRLLAGVNRQYSVMTPGTRRKNPCPVEAAAEPGNGGRISGPSFLGLNSQPESNDGVEYLLEDEPSGGGLRKVLLLLVMAAILGLLFMQWRSSFKASPKRRFRQNQIHPLLLLRRKETTSRQMASRLLFGVA